MDMAEDKEYEENNMFNTDRDVVEEHFTYEFKAHKDEEYEYEFHTDKFEEYQKYEEFNDRFHADRNMYEEYEEYKESKSFTQKWRLYARCHGGMDVWELQHQLLGYTDRPLEADMYNALGSKIGTLSETDMMEELENLAMEEIVAVISVEKPVNQQPAHSGTAHSHTAHSSTAHRSPAHSSPAKFQTTALAQTLAKQELQR
jgi:hypothetical protein